MSLIKSVQLFTTTDGKQFEDLAAAEAHQISLENAAVVGKVANSFVNTAVAPGAKVSGLSGRTRVFQLNVATQLVSFLIANGVIVAADLEAFEEIAPSEELAVRLEADRVEAEKKAAAAKAKADAKGKGANEGAGEGTGEGDDNPEDPADLFGE